MFHLKPNVFSIFILSIYMNLEKIMITKQNTYRHKQYKITYLDWASWTIQLQKKNQSPNLEGPSDTLPQRQRTSYLKMPFSYFFVCSCLFCIRDKKNEAKFSHSIRRQHNLSWDCWDLYNVLCIKKPHNDKLGTKEHLMRNEIYMKFMRHRLIPWTKS